MCSLSIENLQISVDNNFIDGLTDVKNLLLNGALVMKNINITDGKIIHWYIFNFSNRI